MRECPNCHTRTEKRFCEKCGAATVAADAPPVIQPAPEQKSKAPLFLAIGGGAALIIAAAVIIAAFIIVNNNNARLSSGAYDDYDDYDDRDSDSARRDNPGGDTGRDAPADDAPAQSDSFFPSGGGADTAPGGLSAAEVDALYDAYLDGAADELIGWIFTDRESVFDSLIQERLDFDGDGVNELYFDMTVKTGFCTVASGKVVPLLYDEYGEGVYMAAVSSVYDTAASRPVIASWWAIHEQGGEQGCTYYAFNGGSLTELDSVTRRYASEVDYGDTFNVNGEDAPAQAFIDTVNKYAAPPDDYFRFGTLPDLLPWVYDTGVSSAAGTSLSWWGQYCYEKLDDMRNWPDFSSDWYSRFDVYTDNNFSLLAIHSGLGVNLYLYTNDEITEIDSFSGGWRAGSSIIIQPELKSVFIITTSRYEYKEKYWRLEDYRFVESSYLSYYSEPGADEFLSISETHTANRYSLMNAEHISPKAFYDIDEAISYINSGYYNITYDKTDLITLPDYVTQNFAG